MILLTSLFRAAGIVFMARVAKLSFDTVKRNANASESYAELRSYFTVDKVIGVIFASFIITALFPATVAIVTFLYDCYFIASLTNLVCFFIKEA